MSDDVDEATDRLTHIITAALNKHAPVKTCQTRKKYVPWLSDQVKQLMKDRDDALEKAHLTNDANDRLHYKNLRNTTTREMKRDKKKWQTKKLDASKHNAAALWGNVKSWLNWGQNGPPNKLLVDGKLISSPAALSDSMNNFFINKKKMLKKTIPHSDDEERGTTRLQH